MNIAAIFAGGSGLRMHTKSRPKQFLELNGKPIIIYTLELFDNHPEIDAIVVACIEDWIPFLEKQLRKFEINKVVSVVPGGKTGQDSIYNALRAASDYAQGQDATVLIHDGVRPLITEQTITDNLRKVEECGSCITCAPATETFIVRQADGSLEIPSRADSLIARAPAELPPEGHPDGARAGLGRGQARLHRLLHADEPLWLPPGHHHGSHGEYQDYHAHRLLPVPRHGEGA